MLTELLTMTTTHKFPLQSYLSDMYDAPGAVNTYLCTHKRLHLVPLFERETEATDELADMFTAYYIGSLKFTTKRSGYSNNVTTCVEDMAGRPAARLGAVSVDRAAVENVETELVDQGRKFMSCSHSQEFCQLLNGC